MVWQDVPIRCCASQTVEVCESAGLAPVDDAPGTAHLPSSDPFAPATALPRTSHAATRPLRTAGPSPLRHPHHQLGLSSPGSARTIRVLHPPRLWQGLVGGGCGGLGAGRVDVLASKARRSSVGGLRLGQLV